MYTLKQITFLLIPLVTTTSVLGQPKHFEPSIASFPSLNLDTLAKYQALSDEYHRIINEDVPFDNLTKTQKKLFENELLHSAGPYSTEELGCSWYCAAGISQLRSTTQLDSTKSISYKPENAHDFDLRTAWIEGKPGYGIGEEISIGFELLSNLKVTHIDVYNGYCKSRKVWKDNSRVKTFTLYANNELLGYLHLSDTYQRQRFDIGSLGGDSEGKLELRLKIANIYEGDKYMDTAISEINFDGTGDH